MNKLVFIACTAVAGGLSAPFCQAEPASPKPVAPQPIGPKPGELMTVKGFELSLIADSSGFAAGSPIIVNASIANVTDKTRNIASNGNDAEFHFEVKTADGKLVPLTLFGQRRKANAGAYFNRGPLEIVPGQNWDNAFILNRIFDMTLPGEYTVEASHDVEFKRFDDPTKPMKVTSNVLHITVN